MVKYYQSNLFIYTKDLKFAIDFNTTIKSIKKFYLETKGLLIRWFINENGKEIGCNEKFLQSCLIDKETFYYLIFDNNKYKKAGKSFRCNNCHKYVNKLFTCSHTSICKKKSYKRRFYCKKLIFDGCNSKCKNNGTIINSISI